MANNSKVLNLLKELSSGELKEIKERINHLIESARLRENEGHINLLKKKARLGLLVNYKKGAGPNKGTIAGIREEGVQLNVQGKDRRIFVKWTEVTDMSEKSE